MELYREVNRLDLVAQSIQMIMLLAIACSPRCVWAIDCVRTAFTRIVVVEINAAGAPVLKTESARKCRSVSRSYQTAVPMSCCAG